jgi:hypothetical protein
MLKINVLTLKNLLALDAEFDKTVEELIDEHEKMEASDNYEDIAIHALQAGKLERKAQDIFNSALELLEG